MSKNKLKTKSELFYKFRGCCTQLSVTYCIYFTGPGTAVENVEFNVGDTEIHLTWRQPKVTNGHIVVSSG